MVLGGTVEDKYTSHTSDTILFILQSSLIHPQTKPPNVASFILNDHINTVLSLHTPFGTLITTTEKDDDSTSTASTTITPNDATFTTTVIVRHTYSTPGIYNLNVQLLYGCRRVAGKDICPAFKVAEPICDLQIRSVKVSKHTLLLYLFIILCFILLTLVQWFIRCCADPIQKYHCVSPLCWALG